MRLLCVIPARIGSTRLPEKPLRRIAGVPLVCRVARRVAELRVGDRVVVATDDRRIADAVRGFGVEATLTDPGHQSGTERVAEVVSRPGYSNVEVVLNLQGDEPFVPPEAIWGAVDRVLSGDAVGTAAAPLACDRASDPNRVKVSVTAGGRAMGFSRTPLPAGDGATCEYLQHVGVYAYTRQALLEWVGREPVREEMVERLEQLRPLKHGVQIGVAVLDREAPPGVDTEEDLRNAEAYLSATGREVGR
jgi:3-deoxy-D-manno-octulosonate cytidylyltransferase